MPDLHGELDGIRKSTLAELTALYDYPVERDEYLPQELAKLLGRYSCAFNREISLYISRDGEIVDISLGTTSSVPLCDIRLHRSLNRLAGIRCIHTHPRGSAKLSDVDLTALKFLWLDSICALGVNEEGQITGVQAAFLRERVNGDPQPVCLPVVSLRRLPQREWMEEIALSETRVRQGEDRQTAEKSERALLIGTDTQESLNELGALADSAGATVVGCILQKRSKPDSATYIGSGKAEELALEAQAAEADVILVDDELTGMQTRNLEDITHVKIVDRTMLILDIFAQRAQSAEGRLQVSLAQLRYQSGRLIGQGVTLSRLAGGIGTRGPGESRLEIDRRRIRERITQLRRELNALEAQRTLRRKARARSAIPVVALVGYTNAGKSTLLNRIAGANMYAQDRLFATLDAVSRNVKLPDGGEFLLVDTVGFIRKLPTELIEAFHSTLEEAALADILVLVSDASAPDLPAQRQAVDEELSRLGAVNQPRIDVLNKRDLLPPESDIPALYPRALLVSAQTGDGIPALIDAIASLLRQQERQVELLVPFDQFAAMTGIRALGRVLSEEYMEEGVRVSVRMDAAAYGKLLARYPQIVTGEQ